MSYRMLTLASLAIVIVGVLEFKQVHDTDIFWQVRLGQIMRSERRILLEDRFTYTHSGQPAPAIGWLAQLLFGSLYDLGGWHLVRSINHLALAGALVTAAATSRREMTSAPSVAAATVVGLLVILSNAELRPQTLGLFCFASLLAIARSRIPFHIKLFTTIPLLVAWQNIHPSVAVGAMALAALSLADFLACTPEDGARWPMAVLAFVAAIAQVATPLEAGIFEVSRANLTISRDVMGLAEWSHPWAPHVVHAVETYWVALVGSAIAMIRLRGRVSARDWSLVVVMTLLSLYAARFIIFWAVALIPFWSMAIEWLCPDRIFAWARQNEPTHPVRAGRAMVGLAAAATIVLGPHPARFQPIVDPDIPVEAVRALREQLPGEARIYNDYIWAGPLLLDGSPLWRVAVDGRLYFFPDPALWHAIDDASAGRVALDVIEQMHRPDAFFLFPPGNEPLIRLLTASPRWRECHRSPTCAVFVRAR